MCRAGAAHASRCLAAERWCGVLCSALEAAMLARLGVSWLVAGLCHTCQPVVSIALSILTVHALNR